MKPLTHYKKNGYNFRVHDRIGNRAVFYGTKIQPCGKVTENWECIEIQSHNGLTFGDTVTEPAEFAPSDKQWGIKGWTKTSREEAEDWLRKGEA